MAELNVRPAAPSDAELIYDLICALGDYEKLRHEVVATPDALRAHLFADRPFAEALIGEIDGRPAGYALFFPTYSTFLAKPGIWLEDLFVLEADRGHGLGQALIAGVAAEAVRRGSGRLEWSVLDWNEPSIAFYRSLGAGPVDGWTTYRLIGGDLDALAGRAAGSGGGG